MKKLSILLLSLCIPVVFVGCDNSNSSKPSNTSPPADNYTGVWENTGYGEYLNITNDLVTRYEASPDSCIKTHIFTRQEFPSKLHWTITDADDYAFSAYLGTNSNRPFVIDKISALPASCATPLTNTPTNVINHLVSMAQAYYSFFDARNIDWPAISQQAKVAVHDEMTEGQLGAVVAQLMSALEDAHVVVYFKPLDLLAPEIDYNFLYPTFSADTLIDQLAVEYTINQPDQTLEEYTQEQVAAFNTILLSDVEDIKSHNGKIIWGLKGDLGYVVVGNLSSFDPDHAGDSFSEALDPSPHVDALNVVLDELVSDLQHTNGIILDLRQHAGGTTEMDRALAKRFIEQTIQYGSYSAPSGESVALTMSPYDGARLAQKTVMITSELNQSSAEDLILALKADGNTVQVGEATQGIFSDMLYLGLPNQWVFSLSNQVWLDSNGTNWEVEGLQPDFEVPLYLLSDRESGIDSTIEKARDLLQ
ncbi:Uncharacterised protein [BD1-7 clade bacterium]|uniref:Tail specific protease domain-containing protein n=1 Tax=BD1-7 clade bacterium TaxID=2029982 RepID=A0A5S9PI71_9GAMM|nr:Uncharacterised protein [BD1-7 clade bacterium]